MSRKVGVAYAWLPRKLFCSDCGLVLAMTQETAELTLIVKCTNRECSKFNVRYQVRSRMFKVPLRIYAQKKA